MTFRVEREISEPEDPRFPECLFVERLDITFLRKMRSIPYPNTVITSTAHQLRQRMKFPGVLAAKSLETCWYFRPLRRYFRSVSGSEPFIRPKFMPTGARVSAFSPTENTARILYMEKQQRDTPCVNVFYNETTQDGGTKRQRVLWVFVGCESVCVSGLAWKPEVDKNRRSRRQHLV